MSIQLRAKFSLSGLFTDKSVSVLGKKKSDFFFASSAFLIYQRGLSKAFILLLFFHVNLQLNHSVLPTITKMASDN